MTRRTAYLFALAGWLIIPCLAAAQQTGSIAGTVRDTTGGILPGVTVEASSPALIEKVRTGITDGTGQYRIVDLRPGVYTVTFTLPGFATVQREGIDLTVGFTATVNVEMRVGAVEETITVSGASPVVDIQNVNKQQVMTRQVLDTIPSGRQFTNLASLIPGVILSNSNGNISQDVGGMTGMTFTKASIHGGRPDDSDVTVNGMSLVSLTSVGNARTNLQDGNVEEYSMQLAAASAEFPYGGVGVNVIPREGGNTLNGAFFGSFTKESLQANNLTDDLRQRGLSFPNQVKQVADVNPSVGGRLLRDRLWFYSAYRYLLTESYVGGLYYNNTPAAWTYTPDRSRRAVMDQEGNNGSVNLTWQASPKNKLSLFYNYEYQCYCHFGINPNWSPEASRRMISEAVLYQLTWSSPITSRLLLEAGASHYLNDLPRGPVADATEPPIVEQSTGLTFRSATSQGGYVSNDQTVDTYRASLSYVTGAHALKVGFSYLWQFADDKDFGPFQHVHYRTLNGVPNLVTFFTTPYATPLYLKPFGLYLQEQWTLQRWTLNAGLRYDQFRTNYNAINLPPVRWLPVAREYPGAEVLNWKDLSPRFGASWDVFGTGKTAVKATLNRYILQEGKTFTTARHPVVAATNTVSRVWNDTNGDFIVQGGPLNPAANGELGPSPNLNFGKPITTLRYDPDWATGFGTRPYNWETSVALQHELVPRVAVEAAYFRRWYGNFVVTDNVLVSPSDYDSYCITAPVDARLPGGGGQQICGLFDINPTKVGLVDNLRTYSGKYGDRRETWNGMDLTMNARLGNGVLVQGGMSTGKTMRDDCDVVTKIDNPSTYRCHQESKFLTQVKFLGSYPLPWWGIQLSGTFLSIPLDGRDSAAANPMGMQANYVATNAVIRPSLGRNLAATSNATVPLIEPGTLYVNRSSQLDLRVARTFSVGPARLQGLLDIYNVLNANPVFVYNNSYGTDGRAWFAPQALLPGRLVRFGAQLNF